MSEPLLRIITVLNFIFGILGATLLMAGGLVFAVQVNTEEDRKYRRIVLWLWASCGAYWGFWLVRWIITGNGLT